MVIRQERWESVEPLVDALNAAAGNAEDAEQAAHLFAMVARTQENLMDSEGALDAWRQAISNDPENVENRWGLARLLGQHAVASLELANTKFQQRFRALEALAMDRGLEMPGATLEELDQLWEEVKQRR